MTNKPENKARAYQAAVPPPPQKPDPNECCGSGCVPCIYDYYFDRLDAWEALYGPLHEYQAAQK